MPIDHYSPCPCGSGKKLKFCKCVDNPQDFEKIVRLIEGGQEIAALDRINQMLKKTPNAAWLLAIKGELALGMEEIDSFRETSKRFLKLRPDNPLALLMMAVASVLDNEPHEVSARYLLQGMAESRESLPLMALNAIQVLIQSLMVSGKSSMAGYWGEVFESLDRTRQHASVLNDPDLNLLVKGPAKIIEDKPGAGWKERMAEVIVLSRSFRYDQAEKKLQAILRDFPGQPGPLSHLYRAQYAQLDQKGAYATAKKLSENLEVSPEDRAYFAALSMEIEPDQASLQTPSEFRYCEVDSEDRVVEALASCDFIVSVDHEASEEARHYFGILVKDEVPARHMYTIFDHSPTEESAEATEPTIVSSLGNILIFGKQTDKPSRVLLKAHCYPGHADRISQVHDLLQLGSAYGEASPALKSPYTQFLARQRHLVGSQAKPTFEQLGKIVVEEFLNLPIQVLGDQSPLQANQDESKRAKLLGLLYHLEGEQNLVMPSEAIDGIYQRLDLQRPRVSVERDQPLQLTRILDLDRVKIADLSAKQLQGLMMRGFGLGASRVCTQCALAILESDELMQDVPLKLIVYTKLLQEAPSLEEKLEYSVKLEEALASNGRPVGSVILQRLGILQALGRSDEAQAALLQATRQYPEDPYLLNFMEYAMQGSRGRGGGEFMPSDPLADRASKAPAGSTSDSGLVLPGQNTPSSGESKLWLPGS